MPNYLSIFQRSWWLGVLLLGLLASACGQPVVIVVTATPTSSPTATPPPATTPTPMATPIPTTMPTATATAGGGTEVVERVIFDPGTTSASRSGNLPPLAQNIYLLNGQAGQTLSVTLFPQGPGQGTFIIVGPNQQQWTANDVSYGGPTFARIITLPQSGDYQVIITASRGKLNPINYQVDFTILDSSAQPPAAPPTRVTFDAGASEKSITGSLPEGGGTARYVLHANAGQEMLVWVGSAFVPVGFTIQSPTNLVWEGEALGSEGYIFARTVTLPDSGDYVVTLTTAPGANATVFNLLFKIDNATLPPPEPAERINFDPGATSTTRTGALAPGASKQYLLTAAAGQTMEIRVWATGNTLPLTIHGPSGGTWTGTPFGLDCCGTKSTFTLPESGDYLITLEAPAADNPTDFTVDFVVLNSSDEGPSSPPERVKFIVGATEATLLGSLPDWGGVKRYVLGAQVGQTMEIHTVAANALVMVTITSPSGQEWYGEAVGSEVFIQIATVVLPESGDYLVTLQTAEGAPATLYDVTFRITG